MGKKANKQQSGLVRSVSSSHAYMRVNFLHQAAMLLTEQSVAQQTETQNTDLTRVAQFYTDTMCEVMRKGQVQIHPHMKRMMCHKCHRVFIAGSDGGFRLTLSRKGPKRFVVTCVGCGAHKTFPMRRDHQLSVERQEQQPLDDNRKL